METKAISCALAALVLVALPACTADDDKSDLVKRGDYLATTSGCKDCHTPGFFYGAADAARELAGSDVGWHGPWGTTYPPNLTPDTQTGLGKWTDAEILRAIRTGVRPDGTVLRPPMPWQHFAVFKDRDVNALVAYLRSLPPVQHAVPKALPPGVKPTGAIIDIPPPPAWDAPRQTTAQTPTPPETKSRASEEFDEQQQQQKSKRD